MSVTQAEIEALLWRDVSVLDPQVTDAMITAAITYADELFTSYTNLSPSSASKGIVKTIVLSYIKQALNYARDPMNTAFIDPFLCLDKRVIEMMDLYKNNKKRVVQTFTFDGDSDED